MFIPDAPIYLGIFLGVIVLFVSGVSFYFWKKVKEENENVDTLPGGTKEDAALLKEKQKEQKKREKQHKKDSDSNVPYVETSENEEEEEATDYIFGSDSMEIVPQGVRNVGDGSAPYDFSVEDRDKFASLPQNPHRIPDKTSLPTTPSELPTRRSKRELEWE